MIKKIEHAYGKDYFGQLVNLSAAQKAFSEFFSFHSLGERGPDDGLYRVDEVVIFPGGYPGSYGDFEFAFMCISPIQENESAILRLAGFKTALRYAKFNMLLPEARVFAVFRDDEDGRQLSSAIVEVFGPERVMVGRLNSIPTPDGVEAACHESLPAGVSKDVASVRDLEREYADCLRFSGGGGLSTGLITLDPLYTVAPGELTVVTGYPNQGKSEFVDQLAVNLWRRDGGGTAFFSPENRRGDHVRKLAEKSIGSAITSISSEESSEGFLNILDAFYWIFPSNPTIGAILARAEHLASTGKISRLVIDPYNEIEQDRKGIETETEYVSRMLSAVKSFAKRRNVHVWFVAHPRKPEGAEKTDLAPPGLAAISGSQHWVNKTDNGIVVARGENGQSRVIVRKIRNKRVGKLGECILDYDPQSGVFSDSVGRYTYA